MQAKATGRMQTWQTLIDFDGSLDEDYEELGRVKYDSHISSMCSFTKIE